MSYLHNPFLASLLALTSALFFNAGSLNAQIHESSADTGRMTWGRKDFTAYQSARPCDRAIREVDFDLSRTYIRDTAFQLVVPNNKEPEIPREVIEIANACGKKFTLENIDPQELWSLMRISFARQDEKQAMAAFERRYALAESEQERIAVLAKGSREILRQRPLRLTLVLDILKRLDAFGDSARTDRVAIRMLLLDYWYERYNVDSIQTYAWSIVTLSKDLPQNERNAIELQTVWEKLFTIANIEKNIPAQRALVDSAIAHLSGWRGSQGDFWLSNVHQAIDIRQELYGKKTRPLSPDAWRNDEGIPRPILGKLSMVLKTDHNCGSRCYDIYNITRQLIAQYGDDIDVTYAVASVGYAPGTGPLGFTEEANAIKKYFVDYLKLPIALAVFETPMDKSDDGRIIRSQSSLEENFPSIDAIIIDKSGNVRWLGRLRSQHDKRMIDAAIANILRGT